MFREYISKKSEPIEEILAEALDVENFEYDRSTLAKGDDVMQCIYICWVSSFNYRCTRIYTRSTTELSAGAS